MKKDTLFILILTGIIGLLLIFFLTPVYSWVTGGNKEPASPPATTQTPVDNQPPQITEPPPLPPTTIQYSTFTEEELQKALNSFIETANQSDKVNIEYTQIKLEQDKILISAKGEAMGYSGETENLEVRFEGRTVHAEGIVKAFGLSPKMTLILDITTTDKKPVVSVTTFKLGGLPMTMLNLGPERISGIINSQIESRGWKLPADLESISIQDGKLVIDYK